MKWEAKIVRYKAESRIAVSFEKDAALIARLESLITRLKNAKILYDYDNYQAALDDYACTTFMAGIPGAKESYDKLKQRFETVFW